MLVCNDFKRFSLALLAVILAAFIFVAALHEVRFVARIVIGRRFFDKLLVSELLSRSQGFIVAKLAIFYEFVIV